MKADFSGYASRAGVKCSDGRTIMPNAFSKNNGQKVPLVWQHGHRDPENVLGHALLEDRDDGVYAYGFFNETPKAKNTKIAVQHGDINSLSIYANNLKEERSNVQHGVIREVSLVLSGANPEARIDNVYLKHSDGYREELDDEVVIYSGETLAHSEDGEQSSEKTKETEGDDDGKTIQDVLDGFSEEQLNVLYYLVGEASGEEGDDEGDSDSAKDSNDTEGNSASHSSISEGEEMTRNVFEKNGSSEKTEDNVLTHSQIEDIFKDAERTGSLKESVLAHAEKYGIENIDLLFPDAKTIRDTPDFISRRNEWVAGVLSGTSKVPFTRIKSMSADITHDEARAKGYVTGNMKKEEYFGVSKRETTPTTIYKKQKLDRDDIIDITSFDVVAWMKAEMRVMLDEEIARAILFGDGRAIDDEDKIQEDKIRPVATDHEFYTHKVYLDTDAAPEDIIEDVIRSRKYYKGSGNVVFYTSEDLLTDLLLQKDQLGRRLYRSEQELASEMRVSRIITTELLDDTYLPEAIQGLRGLMVNLSDYSVGTDRGGQVTMFDDFDIDYNQYKYLIEGRMSGALTKPKSAIAFWEAGTFVENEDAAPSPIDHKQIYKPEGEATHHKQVRRSNGDAPTDPTGEE